MGRQAGALGEAALRYAERGLAVFPVKPKGKAPLTKNGFKSATTDSEKIRRWWARHPRANIGLVPGGAGGLVVLDVDTGGMDAAREAGLLDIETARVRTGSGGLHILLRKQDPTVEIGNVHPWGAGIDVRADAGYVVAPPSVHPSGDRYEWEAEREPALCPEGVWELLASGPKRSRNGGPSNAGKVAKGGRNDHLASRAGSLRKAGMSDEALLPVLLAINEAECDPPLSEREVEGVLKSAEKWERGEDPEDVITRLNERFAFVMVGGKAVVLWEKPDGGWDLLTPPNFRTLLAPEPQVPVGKSFVTAANFWLQSPARRAYPGGIVFEPGEARTPGSYNLFRGWAVEPSGEGECGLFLDHLRDNVARGDPELYEWVVGWFAQVFQRPDRKLGTSLVLIGRQGTGKSIVGNVIGRLMKDYYRTVSDPRYLTGQFNAHLEHTLLLQAEEAFWAGDKPAEGALKHLITSEVHEIERKYFDSVQAPNHVRLFITSNATWAVPAGLEERRFAVLDMGEGRMQDHAYFGAMIRQLEEEDGYAALLRFLLDWEVDEERLRKVPRTAALAEQKLHSLTIDQEWLYNILDEGMLPGDNDGTGECLKTILHDHYTDYTRKIGRHTQSTSTQLGIFLREQLPGLSDGRPSRAGERIKVYRFPPLDRCRAAFGRDLGIEWPEGEEWRPWDDPF